MSSTKTNRTTPSQYPPEKPKPRIGGSVQLAALRSAHIAIAAADAEAGR